LRLTSLMASCDWQRVSMTCVGKVMKSTPLCSDRPQTRVIKTGRNIITLDAAMLIKKGQKVNRIKGKRFEDKAHLDFVRQLPCCVCFEDRSDVHRAAHHLMRGVLRGVGRKAPDSAVIPLCSSCHSNLHENGCEVTYLSNRGIQDPVGLAKTLFENTDDYEKCWHIVCNAKEK